MTPPKEWFASWFDSPYYPILYQNRDYEEAEAFIRTLVKHLAPEKDAFFLDLACGRGRHSRFLNELGLRVQGLDLSEESIAEAKQFANERLSFQVHDMRDPLPQSYDYILNLFTSFGYFNQREENLKVLQNIQAALRPGGVFVLDYMNAHKVVRDLVEQETKSLDGVHFDISRTIDQGAIVKTIHIQHDEESHTFEERVQPLSRQEIRDMAEEAGLVHTHTWGGYSGEPWDEGKSSRLILFFTT